MCISSPEKNLILNYHAQHGLKILPLLVKRAANNPKAPSHKICAKLHKSGLCGWMNNGCGHSQAPLQPHFVKLQCRGGLHRDLQQVGCSWVLLLVCPVKETLQVWEFGKLCCALHCSKAELVGFLPTVENQYKIKPVDYKKGSSNTSNQRLLRFIFK